MNTRKELLRFLRIHGISLRMAIGYLFDELYREEQEESAQKAKEKAVINSYEKR